MLGEDWVSLIEKYTMKKYIKNLVSTLWILVNHNNRMQEDTKKIEAKLAELNKDKAGLWESVEDFNMMPSVTFRDDRIITDQNRGYLGKLFLNTQTGEIKVFDSDRFVK